MRMRLTLMAFLFAGALALSSPSRGAAADEKGPLLVHNVFFTLKESNKGNRDKLIASCKKYLTKHPGVVYFAAGPLVKELDREVNDRNFDVALTIVFKDKAAHDTYQDAKRHLQFIEESKGLWSKVRVFDSYAER